MNERVYAFSWDLIGDLKKGRPNLGSLMRIEAYRLFQFTLRDIIEQFQGKLKTDEIFYRAGFLAGQHFCHQFIPESSNFNEFIRKVQATLLELGIGILRVEDANLEAQHFVLSIAEDLDCSGLLNVEQEVCVYDEGFIAGIFYAHTGLEFKVKEIECWCNGGRSCRFTVTPPGQESLFHNTQAAPLFSNPQPQVTPPQPQNQIDVLHNLFFAEHVSAIPTKIEQSQKFVELCQELTLLRDFIDVLSQGDIRQPYDSHGFIPDRLKSFQSNLRHLTWQAECISRGDYRQRIQFMGDFSLAFNCMTKTLQKTMRKLQTMSEKYRTMSFIDSLTELPNRRAFFKAAERELRRAIRTKRSLALVMLDLDKFKAVNDTYGHLAGDAVLKAIGKTLQCTLRQEDLCARYGGEEFVVLLPEADLNAAYIVAERLRKACQEQQVTIDDFQINVTISLGTSLFDVTKNPQPDLTSTINEAIDLADQAMYAAKQNGRNRTCTPADLVTVSHPSLFSQSTMEEA